MNQNMVDGYTATPSHVIVHEEYDDTSLNNNIALIYTNDLLIFHNHGVLPVSLANSQDSDPSVGKKLIISGWCLSQTNDNENVFQSTDVGVISRNNCSRLYQGQRNLTTNMICTKNNLFRCSGKHCFSFKQILTLMILFRIQWNTGC